MNKKGQGISMNVIIIAAIALIVMIVLIAIFTGRIGMFQQEAEKGEEAARARICATGGRACIAVGNCPDGTLPVPKKDIPVGGWIDCTGTCCEKETSEDY